MPRSAAKGSWAVGVQLFAYFLAEESRSAGGPKPAFCQQIRHAVCTAVAHNQYRQRHSRFQQNQPLAQSHQAQAAIKITAALSPATDAGSRPGRRVTFLARTRNVTQRMRPDCLRPCASLRANLRHALQSAVRQNSLCAARAAQTRCRKLDDEATLPFGRVARSLNRVSQAQTHGWERARTACMSCDEINLQRLSRLR